MKIPTIGPYHMPTESDLPGNQVPWQPDPSRALLLIHDMQRYFVDFYTPGGSPLRELIENIHWLHSAFRELDVPTVYTAQPGGMSRVQRGLLWDFWGPGMRADPGDRQIIDELTPADGDTVLTKWRYSAFHRTGLKALLDEHGRDQLIICGVYAHIGCLLTAYDSFAFDVQPFIVADAVSDFSLDEHRRALDYAARRCAAVVCTRGLLDSLAGCQPAA